MPLPPKIGLLIWLCLLTLLPCIFAILNIIDFTRFWNLRSYQYLNSRKPKLLLLYTVLVSISLFVVTPIRSMSIYIQSLHRYQFETHMRAHEWWFTCFMIFDSIYGSIFCTLINIIAVRVWLLFYDHKFAIATVDRIWRKSINPSDKNFFLNYKKTLGNDQFLLKLVFTIWVAVLLLILLIVMLSDWSSLYISHKYVFFALRVFIAIPVAIFIFTIYYKIKTINDEFHLRKEMQSLGKWVLFITLSSITTLAVVYSRAPLYIFETIVYSFDVLFIVCSAHIQIKSVLRSLIRNLNNIKHNGSASRHKLTMLDVLRDRNAFEAFMRHCVNELSVESLLFLVEVAQYKATLSKHHAPDPMSQFYSLNVQKVNLREILLDSRFEQRLSITNDPFVLDGRSNSRRSIIDFVDSHSRSNRSTARSSSVASSGAAASAKKESKFQQFQQSILDRKWLPISWQVPPSNGFKDGSQSLLPQTQIASKSMRDLKILNADTVDPVDSTEIKGLKVNEVVTSQRPRTNSEDRNNNIISSTIKGARVPSIVVNLTDVITINSHELSASPTNSPDSPSISQSPAAHNNNNNNKSKRFNFKDITIIKAKNAPKTPKTPKTPNCTVSAEWIRDFATFLHDKYIKDGSEHAVNISGWTRRFLTHLFNQQDDESFFQYIVRHSGGEKDVSQCPAAAINQQLLINTYLYHVFDQSFDEIWSLMRQNAFMRFTLSEGYKRLLREKETNGARLSKVLTDALHLQKADIKYQKSSTTTGSSDDPTENHGAMMR